MLHDPLYARQHQPQVYQFNERHTQCIFPGVPEIFLNGNLSSGNAHRTQGKLSQETKEKSKKKGNQ